jgi:pimeloyl-ACP methyl ester carboxylesterase
MSTADAAGAASGQELDTLAPELAADFAEGTADVNGTTLHYVRGGSGPALVLLHGFPQDWLEWRRMMPRLAQRFTVVAVDLRGVGGSGATADGYAAADQVAYALVRRFPDAVRTVTIVETPVPGIEPWLELKVDVPMWHGPFHMVPGLPEALVADRQAVYFRYFFDVGTNDNQVVSDADLQHFAAAYGDPEHLHAAFEMYRATPANMAYNAGQTGPVDVPLLLVGGEQVFGPAMTDLAGNLRANYGWSDVEVQVVAGGRHYLPDEYPDELAGLIERHAAGS